MSKLNIDQKTIKQLFEDKKADFLVPDYQRPYAWDTTECQTLWDDVLAFAFPDNNCLKFDSSNDEYFLGPIVTFKNDDGKMEIIDGQQRLTTLMLLLRAFYTKFRNMQDEDSRKVRESIEQCIWKTDEFGKPDDTALKINSEVATDNDKEEFMQILVTGTTSKEQKSNYAQNFRFIEEKIDEFLSDFPSYFSYLPIRILNNCILLPIEADNQNTALRIFSTLNDRGKPLSDADIFKAQLYKYYSVKGQKDQFIKEWRVLEEICEKIFHPITGTPMDELFTRYMYYERAKMGIKTSTTEALRKFYERNSYSLLKKNETFENLIILANFWNDVSNQSIDRFSDKVLRRLFVLNYAPNGMWTYFISVYFMKYKDENGMLDEDDFCDFLSITTAFIWTYAVMNPGVNALRTPVYAEMVNIVNDDDVKFIDFKFNISSVENVLNNFDFSNGRPITKSMLAWWALNNDKQEYLSLETVFEIEHIFARNRQDKEKSLSVSKSLEKLGNKTLLEKRINIRASDYRFDDKVKYYKGFINSRNQKKEGTQIQELISFADNLIDFTESDIIQRNSQIIQGFLSFLGMNNLIKYENELLAQYQE
ncbi:MAG: DUF262 domain-containing HNH endonuclease family protein [Eubacteriaceae bacterium]|nr:DUF262 domain-containing HNH endonuclease family protein [Eubacteriaceae bacterium]